MQSFVLSCSHNKQTVLEDEDLLISVAASLYAEGLS